MCLSEVSYEERNSQGWGEWGHGLCRLGSHVALKSGTLQHWSRPASSVGHTPVARLWTPKSRNVFHVCCSQRPHCLGYAAPAGAGRVSLAHRGDLQGDVLRHWIQLLRVQGSRASGPLHRLELSRGTTEILLCRYAHTESLAREVVLVALNLVFRLRLTSPSCLVGCPLLRIHSSHGKPVANAHTPPRGASYYDPLPVSAPTAPSIRISSLPSSQSVGAFRVQMIQKRTQKRQAGCRWSRSLPGQDFRWGRIQQLRHHRAQCIPRGTFVFMLALVCSR